MLGVRQCWASGARGLRVSAGLSVADPGFKAKLVSPDLAHPEGKIISLEDVLHPHGPRPTSISVQKEESALIGGIPETHSIQRRARIFRPAREAPQTAWNNTKLWKIELDNQERWENPNIGWASSADPMSSLGMHMKFARCEDAVRFCEKNGWEYEVVEPQERNISPKVPFALLPSTDCPNHTRFQSYGENFHWSKKTRIGCK